MKTNFTLICCLLLFSIQLISQSIDPPNSNARNAEIHFAYPVILVHGLNGSSASWKNFADNLTTSLGWSEGGLIKFNLNYDGNHSTCDVTTDYKSFAHRTHGGADLYRITFNTDRSGDSYSSNGALNNLSNQAAVVKQGYAIRDAIKRVLELTGRNKVILMGHSMGGLAIRQYLQNPNIWQSDGHHHVAKIATVGTPHGGSNATDFLSIDLGGIDEQSEAVRDLRRSYFYSGNSGVFLFGGKETHTVMNDHLINFFYNVDVNCNGFTNHSTTGLNQKPLPDDIEIAFIASILDGVVSVSSAEFGRFYPHRMESYSSGKVHTVLPSDLYANFVMLDEPDEYETAYEMPLNAIINGYITNQGISNYAKDYDIFKISFPESGSGTLTLDNAGHSGFELTLRDYSTPSLVYQTIDGTWDKQTFYFSQIFKGDYYLQIEANPNDNNFYIPYNVTFDFTPEKITSVSELVNVDLKLYPNPATTYLTIEVEFDELLTTEFSIVNTLGQEVTTWQAQGDRLQHSLEVDGWQKGMYFLLIETPNGVIQRSFVIN